MPEVSIDGVRIAYTDAGVGDPVVLVGGSGMTAGAWDLSIRPRLIEAGHRMITLDVRGAGDSEAPTPPYTIDEMAGDAIGVIERVMDGPCRLVGLSLGGFVAEDVCHLRPDIVRSVALIASAGPTTAYMRAKLLAEAKLFGAAEPVSTAYDRIDALTVTLPPKVLQDDDATVEQWAELLALAGTPDEAGRLGQSAAARDWLLNVDRVARWPTMRTPALLIAFEHDLQFPPSRARETAKAWPGASFAEITGVAHGNGAFDAAEAVAEAIIDFHQR